MKNQMNVLFLKPLKYLKLEIGEPKIRLDNRSFTLLNLKTEQRDKMERNRQNIVNTWVIVKQSR